MAYWLMKSEPHVYPWAELARDGKGGWDGVRNHQAANNMRAMTPGDQAFFYHSNEGKEIVGIMKIVRAAYPDKSDKAGKFVMVDVVPVRALKKPVTLAQIKADKALKDMALVRQGRLSVSPVTAAQWKRVLALGEQKG
ncbi:MAG: EVE domain-containing protein [Alphaproteobacteria bacterium]|nr:EVE domain-containing protein [Alphaproteobacteria bacterium]